MKSRFAPRPFAPKVEEHEASAAGPGVDFNFADIDLIPRETVQPKLVLGPVGDKYEQEADRVARQVVDTISSSNEGAVQRQEDLEDEEELDLEEEELRRKVDLSSAGGADVGPDLESAIHQARGQGQPLSDGVRQPMERAFGADFGGVRVHADGEADSLNRSLQARAFTTGQDIFLRKGEYRPGSSEGQRLLAHELTHVVQQNGESVQRVKPTGMGNVFSAISLEQGDRLSTLTSLDNRSNSITMMQKIIQRTPSTTALTVPPNELLALTGKVCWDAVAYCLYLDGLIDQNQYAHWGPSEQSALARLVDLNDPQSLNGIIPANYIVGIFRDENGRRRLSHVMLSLGGGLCIGSNNGCIGGAGSWSVVDITANLNWPGPDYLGNARYVHYRSVANAVGRF